MSDFYKKLEQAKNEKDVENYYREHINAELKRIIKNSKEPITIVSPYNTDGVLKYDDNNPKKENRISIHTLFEFKYNVNLDNKSDRCKVLIQTLYYLKKFELNGEIYMPTTIFIGDINECLVIHTNKLKKYLEYKLDWNIAPSNAANKNLDLLKDMISDKEIDDTYVFNINSDFDFFDVLTHINEITKETAFKHKITPKNVHKILKSFLKNVLTEKSMSVNDKVNLFIQSLLDRDSNYLHPNKPNLLVTKGFGEVKIDSVKYKQYINFFETDLLPSEKEALTATQDRLIQDETRRIKGEFFTPTIWVDESHKMISEQFGEDWKEKYVVWDGSSGTGNLTRDYKFKELYCSTLNGSDIETMNQAGYNPEATKFQYDFLNDGIIDGKIDIENDTKLPEGLKKALLEGKEIIFFMNPPYGSSGEAGAKSTHKDGISDTKISNMMKIDKFGNSGQLYTQFLYRIYTLNKINKNIKICLFSPPLFLSGSSFKNFRTNFFKYFNYVYGYLMNSLDFSDISSWGISFSIWNNNEQINKNSFNYDIKENNLDIKKIGNKIIYNVDNNITLSDFCKIDNIDKIKKIDKIRLSSALKSKHTGRSMSTEKSIGHLQISSNNVYQNSSGVALYSTLCTADANINISYENFIKSNVAFSARKLIKSNWVNQKDEYVAPTEEIQQTTQYKQFESDSIVYSLFNTSSNQSSMRQVEYKDKLWDIKNEFFFMSKDEMKQLAETLNFYELYKDVKTADERYVYNLLKTTNLSPDAQDVLDTAKELVRKSFEWRKIMHNNNPEYHLQAWDAGWYQIKKVLNEYFKDDLKSFNKKYKTFEDRLRPQVYELGFLKGEEVEVVE
jgi:hypothetical protein